MKKMLKTQDVFLLFPQEWQTDRQTGMTTDVIIRQPRLFDSSILLANRFEILLASSEKDST